MTLPAGIALPASDRASAAERYQFVRTRSTSLCEPLTPEDMVVQVALFASPAKWHLAHTTWFFETFVLERFERGFTPYSKAFRVLFNSYYHGVGNMHPRARRGVLTRPGLGEVMAYRDTVDERVQRLLREAGDDEMAEIVPLLVLGLQHEQQHQELLLTDVKYLLAQNPLLPAYAEEALDGDGPVTDPGPMDWRSFEAGVVEIGHDARAEPDVFAYDNEGPRHRRFVEAYALADRPITNGEFLAFMEDGGYKTPQLWLDEGWATVNTDGWSHPLYWMRDEDGAWSEFTMSGKRRLDPHMPATHLSFFEADAYARWAGLRLPTEVEWEHAATMAASVEGAFVDDRRFHPSAIQPAETDDSGNAVLRNLFGDGWEWTRSSHEPYPGYAPPSGAVGEYNGKFMCGSFVLRGGSCATSRDHLRVTYRNFFEPSARWQFAGVRLARSE